MSKGSLFWGNAVGKLGENVFYRANGQQRNRTYLRSFNNPKTRSQMSNRIKWANVINTWRLLKPFIMMGMQNRKTNQSDYNKFVSLNVSGNSSYLLKEQAKQGGTVLAPYILTSGTLGLRSMRTAYITGIQVGNIDLDSATIGQLSAAIVNNNQGFAVGDQITVIALGQAIVDGVPMVVPSAFKFIIAAPDADDFALDAIEVSGTVAPAVEDGFLAWKFSGVEYSEYAGAVIQSRIAVEGTLSMSDSRLAVAYDIDGVQQGVNPFAITEDEALASYGYRPAVYLSPASAGEITPSPRITSVTFGGREIEAGQTIQDQTGSSTSIKIIGANLVDGAASVDYDGTAVPLTLVSAELLQGSVSVKSGSHPITISWNRGSVAATIDGQSI